ncbi:hypothetical protein [Allobranchiibius sp. CTAmp26]|uniref:hypothetical protein n=1 Tax=Allobranchiibius sp. CTAmp26 TaxID=2815214 RepID=UPI001AA16A77|nr:hypothetical protein [Allobranchiibius sp. CTAmp26]MBO1756523.1 hypothetical protein [Allobranchiibius sp. CTAmp26]
MSTKKPLNPPRNPSEAQKRQKSQDRLAKQKERGSAKLDRRNHHDDRSQSGKPGRA